MLLVPVAALPSGGHIEYRMIHDFASTGTALYVAATAGPLLASFWRPVRLFGALVLAAFVPAWLAYAHWLVSVWCFFAGLLSAAVLAQVLPARQGGSPPCRS